MRRAPVIFWRRHYIHGVTDDVSHECFVEMDFRGQVGKGDGAIAMGGLRDAIAHDGLQPDVSIVLLP